MPELQDALCCADGAKRLEADVWQAGGCLLAAAVGVGYCRRAGGGMNPQELCVLMVVGSAWGMSYGKYELWQCYGLFLLLLEL